MKSILSSRLSVIAAALWIGLGAIFFGVGGDSPSRVSLFGSVKLDGAPLDHGTIYFLRLDSSQPASGASKISHGHFSVGDDDLLEPGTYEVRISGLDVIVVREAQGEGATVQADPVPDCYNFKSVIQVVIPRGGSRHLEFDLKTPA
jgi:hypothetical protein